MTAALKEDLIEKALQEGFSSVGVTTPQSIPQVAERLATFVDADRHGQMQWMAERMNWRGDPAALWPEAKSVVMLAESYSPDHNPLDVLDQRDRGAISVYAQNRDYHDIVKKRLKRVGRWLIEQAGGEIKVFVDTAPVMEKALASAAGIGWQGKHTNVVSRDHGSWLFLGAIYTTLDLETDEAGEDRCGSCTACQDICPTNAFPTPYRLDARRCISYLTIEHKGPIPHELRKGIGNHIYGCDDCLAVCPWNKFADSAAANKAFLPRAELTAPKLADLLALDDAAFRQLFSGSPIKRTGRDRFVRNVAIAAGNSEDEKLIAPLKTLLLDDCEIVAEAAQWALAELTAA